MYRHLPKVLLPVLLAAPVFAVAETPEPGEIVDRMIAAAGGEAFSKLGVIKLEVEHEETRNDGTSSKGSYTLFVDTAHLENQRIEYPGDVVVAHHGAGGWSTAGGVIDDRPQTSSMAEKTLNRMYILRKVLAPLSPVDSMEFLLGKIKATETNDEFLESMNS